MRLLFQLDTRDYDPNGKAFVRPSVRGIIIRAGKVGMVHSQKYDYYKSPVEASKQEKAGIRRSFVKSWRSRECASFPIP